MKPLITFLKENYLEDVESRICAINTILGCDVESLYEEGGLELDEILHLDEDHFNMYLEMLMENKEEAGQLDELSKKTLQSYRDKAKDSESYYNRKSLEHGRDYRSAHNVLQGMRGNHLGYTEREKDEVRQAKSHAAAEADRYDKKATKRREGIKRAGDRLTKEEADQLDELSTKTLQSYYSKARANRYDMSQAIKKAYSDYKKASKNGGDGMDHMKRAWKLADKSTKRSEGINRAAARLNREDIEHLDELSCATKTSYLMKAVRDIEKKRGEANKLTGLARNARKNAWAYHDAANNNPDGHIAGTPFSKMGDIYKSDNDRYMDKQQRLSKQIPKRIQGVHRAARALAKEEAMNTENKLNEIEHPKSPKWDPLVTVYEKGSMTGHMWLSTANKIYRTNISAADVRRKKNVTSGNIRFELSPHHKEEYDPTEVNEASYANMGMNVSSMSASDLVRKWSQDPKVRREYEAQQRAKRSRKKVDSKRKSVTTEEVF